MVRNRPRYARDAEPAPAVGTQLGGEAGVVDNIEVDDRHESYPG